MQRTAVLRSNLIAIKDRLKQAKIDWVVFAGAAASCYGSKRKITDVDILVKCEQLKRAKTALNDIDFKGFDIGCGAEIETPQGKCQFFLDELMMEKAKWKRLFGVEVLVMSAEDNIVLKAILQRGKAQRKHDMEDIQCMIAHGKLDLKYLAERVRRCHAEKRVNPLLLSLIRAFAKT